MANKAHVMIRQGRVMQEPKTKQTSNNQTWMSINLAVTTTKKQENSQYPASDFWNINIFGKTAEGLVGKIHAKTVIDVIGDMYMGEPWTDRDGKVHITPTCNAQSVDIISGGTTGNNSNNSNNNNNSRTYNNTPQQVEDPAEYEDPPF